MNTHDTDYLQFLPDDELEEINTLLDYEPIPDDGIGLPSAQMDAAFAGSQRICDPQKRWRVYLSRLALAGFEQWLQSHAATDIVLDRSHVSILEPAAPQAATAVETCTPTNFACVWWQHPAFPMTSLLCPKA